MTDAKSTRNSINSSIHDGADELLGKADKGQFGTAISSSHSLPELVYGEQYQVWKGGNYLGTAVWSKDYVGPYFENFFESPDITKYFIVYTADRWELVNS